MRSKLDPISQAWRALNNSEPPERIRRENLSGSREGEKRGKGTSFVFSPKAPHPRTA